VSPRGELSRRRTRRAAIALDRAFCGRKRSTIMSVPPQSQVEPEVYVEAARGQLPKRSTMCLLFRAAGAWQDEPGADPGAGNGPSAFRATSGR